MLPGGAGDLVNVAVGGRMGGGGGQTLSTVPQRAGRTSRCPTPPVHPSLLPKWETMKINQNMGKVRFPPYGFIRAEFRFDSFANISVVNILFVTSRSKYQNAPKDAQFSIFPPTASYEQNFALTRSETYERPELSVWLRIQRFRAWDPLTQSHGGGASDLVKHF